MKLSDFLDERLERIGVIVRQIRIDYCLFNDAVNINQSYRNVYDIDSQLYHNSASDIRSDSIYM